eukprot:CAMPEP_0174981748 /NCGR_PEP_ID=MMETSP0004_2-20121128/16073_1 /TAXON_ID=420556 /ORGANISM="Ochromonas sp., Strain CCMP1393" /LENGTH=354 /DNA_ID=CAMNT_0016233549 /DNA_START=217 /DNA_END=1281 /DNA_ORIENTATION=-
MEATRQEIEAKYAFGKILGSGTYGTVRLALCMKDFSKWAVKILKKKGTTNEEGNLINNEVQILKKIRHPNIVTLREAFFTKKHIVMIMDRMLGGDLFDRICEVEFFREDSARLMFKQVVLAIQYIHSVNIVHRDLKPENVMFKTKTTVVPLKLIDFGLAATMTPGEKLKEACGSPGYVAPEILCDKPYDEKVDIWSIGVILYILLCGYPPFEHDDKRELFSMTVQGKYHFDGENWDTVSSEAKAVIRRMIEVDPQKRASASEILFDPWMAATTTTTTTMTPSASAPSTLPSIDTLNAPMNKLSIKPSAKGTVATGVGIIPTINEVSSGTKLVGSNDDDDDEDDNIGSVVPLPAL